MRWNFWSRRSRDRDLEEEIAFDLDAEAAENARAGMPPEEAARHSRREFGNVLLVEEAAREAWGWSFLDRLVQDVTYGLRLLARSPGFTAIAVLSLALGIGANTAIFSFMDAILLRALPVPDPQSLVVVQWHSKDFPKVSHSFSGSGFYDPKGGYTSNTLPYWAVGLLGGNPALAQTFAFTSMGRLNVQVRGQADLANGVFVSGTYFSALRIPPAAGRLIGPSDDRPGGPSVAVLSYRYASRRFGEIGNALGQTLLINDNQFLVEGVIPPGFLGLSPAGFQDVYLPLHSTVLFDFRSGKPQEPYVDPNFYWLQIMARLRPGVSRQQAQAAVAPLFHNYVESTATKQEERTDLPALFLSDGAGGLDTLRRQYERPLYVLIAMAGLILALACVNIANLLLARASARSREMAVRLSVGAGRTRVLRQLLTESVLLAMLGGLAGILMANWGIRGLAVLLTEQSPNSALRASLNWHALAVTAGLSLVTGLLFGLAPSLAATRVDLIAALKQVRPSGESRHFSRWLRVNPNQALVVAQIAISLLLVVAAGLFVRTLTNLRAIQLGFNPERLLLFTINARTAGYSNDRLVRFYDNLQTRLQALPGVRGVSASNFALVSESTGSTDNYTIPGYSGVKPSLSILHVAPHFFTTMQIPLLLGREIDARDLTSPSPVAVVNEVFANTLFPNQDPVGRRFDQGATTNIEIIGVARSARYDSLKRTIPPLVYLCYSQHMKPLRDLTFELRATGDPMSLAADVRQLVRQADSRVPVQRITTQEQQIDSTISQERTFAMLCACFAGLAVVIACVGVYGMMASRVARQTNEIGIRMALGAGRPRLLWMVLGEALVLCAVALAIGIPAVLAGSRLVESFLFQVKARDPLTLSLAPAILMAAALAAGYGPAWRASRIDPWSALRDE
jgi:macrolide transport system ATP-binding/permease protein